MNILEKAFIKKKEKSKLKKYERLLNGEIFKTSEQGNSMTPLLKSGEIHIIMPTTLEEVEIDDIVYCRVKGKFYTHLVKAKNEKRGILIGNNHGGINGWTKKVYGKILKI